MKKKISLSAPLFWILIVALLASLFVNLYQFEKASHVPPLQLPGSYCTNAALPNGTYLVFDSKGHYCKYTQTDGLLDEGSYAEYNRPQYDLVSKSGSREQVILEGDGLYYISQDGVVASMTRFSDIPVFIGQWAEDWPGWQDDTGNTLG